MMSDLECGLLDEDGGGFVKKGSPESIAARSVRAWLSVGLVYLGITIGFILLLVVAGR